jgi:hypothetical protein
MAALFVMDLSGELTGDQVAALREFVMLTQSADVRDQFNRAVADGRITVNERLAVIEAAKRAEPGYGLIVGAK